ncbi:MAG: hypothetical protein ACKOBG_09425 [Actinomycetota bacterium]
MPFQLDAQADPIPVLVVAGLVCLALFLTIRSLRRREDGPGGPRS